MAQDPETIRRLTRSYHNLRGYEFIPVVLFFAALSFVPWRRFDGSLRGLLFILLLAFTILAFYAARSYYDRRFGIVERRRYGWERPRWLVASIVLFLALQILSRGFALPVELGFVYLGIACAIHAVRHFAEERQKLLLAVVLLVIAVWPIDASRGPSGPWFLIVALPAALIIMAVWDHRTLVKLFERARAAAVNGTH
jgi:hypothetical protein